MTSPLDGTTWILTALDGEPALPGVDVTLTVEGGTVTGTDGCNRYRGAVTVNGHGFRLAPGMATTLMACTEPVMRQAGAFAAALHEATGYEVRDGGTLVLVDASGAARATFTAQNRDLTGTAWVVTAYNNGRQAVVSPLRDTEITAEFASGTLSGSAGCNRYHATWQADGNGITIGPVATTRRFCGEPEGVMEQEAQYLRALEAAVTLRLEGDRLELRTADGALSVTLARAASPETPRTPSPPA